MTKHVCLVYTEKTSLNYFHTLAIHTDSKIETFDNIYNSRSSGWKRKVNCLSQKKNGNEGLKPNLKLANNMDFFHSWLRQEGDMSLAYQLYHGCCLGRGGALKVKNLAPIGLSSYS